MVEISLSGSPDRAKSLVNSGALPPCYLAGYAETLLVSLTSAHRDVGPDAPEQLGDGNRLVAMAYQVGQHVEGLRFERHPLAKAAQLTAVTIELEVAKAVAAGHGSSSELAEIIHLSADFIRTALCLMVG